MTPQPTLQHAPGEEALLSIIESILLVAGGPVRIAALASAAGVQRTRVSAALDVLARQLHRGIRLQMSGDEVQFVTAPENVDTIHRFLGTTRPPGLSRAALETVTVIAYRQPATRAEIEAVRGVNSDRAVQTLLARGLVEERGQRATPGRPTEYGTSFGFLEYFGLTSLGDLPPLPLETGREMAATGIGLRSSSQETSAE